MKTRRILALILVMMLVFTQFSACGGRSAISGDSSESDGGGRGSGEESDSNTSDEGNPESSEEPEDASEEPAGSDTSSSDSSEFGEGQELTAFVDAYTKAKSACMDKLTAKIESTDDFTLTMGLLGFAFMDLSIAFVPMFDVVDETGMVPMLNLKNAYKKTKGDMVTFGCDFKQDEDSGNNQKDDRVFWDGKLDVKDQSLSCSYYTERNGKQIERSIIEITKNKDGSYTSETVSFRADEDGTGKIEGYFISFEDEDIWMQVGEKADGKPDFDYVSVFNKKNADIKDLSKDFTITTDITYEKGVITNNIKE